MSGLSLSYGLRGDNTWLRANWSSFADGIADYAAETTMGLQATASNATYYGDTIHPTSAEHTLLAPICASAINALG